MDQKCDKMSVFKFIEKHAYELLLNLGHNQSLYYFLSSCTNLMFKKNLVPETRWNVISQSDWRILKFTVSLQQNNELAWFLACSKKN